jgi:hypothetical protein
MKRKGFLALARRSNGDGGNPGTPAGTYTLTITGKDANGLTQSNTAPTVSVTVN